MRQGLPHISWNFLTTSPSYLSGNIGIFPNILNTLYLLIATLAIVLPLGIGAAIYLNEYAKNKKIIRLIELAAETLAGIPSIIYGLVGMLVFLRFFNMKTSLLVGAFTLSIMNLPIILRTTQESLKAIPDSYREGSYSLGAGKWRTIRKVILPNSFSGIITGCILTVGRILGESAALLFTAGFANKVYSFFNGLQNPGATLSLSLYVYAKEQGEFGVAFAIAAVLLILSFLINTTLEIIKYFYQKRRMV